MTLDIWKIKPLEHSKEIGGVWVTCEWAEDLDTLVYGIDDNRYRIVAGATREEIVDQVVDNYLDHAPFGSPPQGKRPRARGIGAAEPRGRPGPRRDRR